MFVVNDPGTTGELNLTVAEALCPSKADTGNQKIKAQFGQQQTHNKQVIVHLLALYVLMPLFLVQKQCQISL